jgi:tRNA G18 (ribose-2'-O)-methylase SpoU
MFEYFIITDSNFGRPMSYVILSNIQSGSNIGNICRNCLAFNVSEVIIVGRRDFKQKMYSADRGAKKWLRFKNFLTYPEAIAYVKGTYMPSLKKVLDKNYRKFMQVILREVAI